MQLRPRNEMDTNYQWNLAHMFPTEEAWEQACARTEEQVKALSDIPGTLGCSKEQLRDGLDRVYAVAEELSLIYIYAMLMKCGDNGDTHAQTLEGRATNLCVKFSAATSFVDPEILTIPQETLQAWMADPLLADYRHILENTDRQRAHTLPEEQEKMLALLADAAGASENAFNMLSNVDMTFPDITGEDGNPAPLTHGTYGLYLESKDGRVRKEAFETYHGEFKKYLNTLAATYSGQVKLENYYTRVRGYESARHKALFADNVPVEVYDALVDAVHESLPRMERYLNLRKKALGLSELHMYDLHCPMVEDVDYRIDYAEAKTLVKKALRPLGEDYQKLLDMAYEGGWIDVYENKGKTAGAFACGVHGVHPYVMLNYTDTLNDAFTLAHELGHAMHSHLSSEKNTFANHDYAIMVAEVASTVNEVLMTRYLLSVETDKKRRAYLLNYLLESFRAVVFRQTLFAEFEREVHKMCGQGEPITAEGLSSLYRSLNETYYRGVVVDEVQDVEWARIPHFYSPFYVYQYATGFCSAVAIADRILETGDAGDYLRFLTTGASDYPMEELKIAGVDLKDPQVVSRAMELFDRTISELETLMEEF